MANANCLTVTDPPEFKLCPFRVYQEEYPPMMRGAGVRTTQEFYPCMGEKCIAYHVGICLRLSGEVPVLYKQEINYGL